MQKLNDQVNAFIFMSAARIGTVGLVFFEYNPYHHLSRVLWFGHAGASAYPSLAKYCRIAGINCRHLFNKLSDIREGYLYD
jgi:hypothetical protein